MSEPTSVAWHARTTASILTELTSSDAGLTQAEAARRLAADGPNAITGGHAVQPWRILLAQFKSLIIWLLVAAGAVSALLGDRVDAVAILTIVVLNAGIGFYQEYQAERSIAALQLLSAPLARVRREGAELEIPAAHVVAGDVLVLAGGDVVAADARLLQAASLHCIESALTGESEAVSKQATAEVAESAPLGDRDDMVFMGTSVTTGRGLAVVVAVAMRTELGHIAGLIEQADAAPKTPLQHRLDAFGRVLVWAALGIVGVLFGLGLWRGTPLLESTLTSVSLAVAAVPEGLPAVVTVALALGVMRMSRRRALVRRLPAVETLGSTSVICTDKTGTLTFGQMTVRQLYVAGARYSVSGAGYGPEGEVVVTPTAGSVSPTAAALGALAEVLVGSNSSQVALCDGVWRAIGDPTEGALLVAGQKAGADRARLDREYPHYHDLPFDSDRKCSTTIRRMGDGRLRAFLNGAPDVLLAHSTRIYTASGVRAMTEADRATLVAENTRMAQSSLRVLGSCVRDLADAAPDALTADVVERELTFVGLSGMHDPPRPSAIQAVADCRAAGIRVVMITGDHPHTAAAIAQELGIAPAGAPVLGGAALDAMDDAALRARVQDAAVYARVTAEHKLRIVRAWQSHDAVVAMTGDGVNDAPAIRGADIGVAMGRSGTDVTKQAADMIITDDDFATIVAAVAEGRGIYDNIRKTLLYLLAGNTGELLLMTVCVVAGLPSPLLPIHLLWINLVTDGLPALCLATDAPDAGVMQDTPRRRSERIANPGFLRSMLWTGVLTAGVTLAVYLVMLRTRDTADSRTAAFTVLVFAELLRSFGARSSTLPLWRIPLSTNPALLGVVTLSFALQFWSHHNTTWGLVLKTTHLPLIDGVVLLLLGAIPMVVLELQKAWRRHRTASAPQAGAWAVSAT